MITLDVRRCSNAPRAALRQNAESQFALERRPVALAAKMLPLAAVRQSAASPAAPRRTRAASPAAAVASEVMAAKELAPVAGQIAAEVKIAAAVAPVSASRSAVVGVSPPVAAVEAAAVAERSAGLVAVAVAAAKPCAPGQASLLAEALRAE